MTAIYSRVSIQKDRNPKNLWLTKNAQGTWTQLHPAIETQVQPSQTYLSTPHTPTEHCASDTTFVKDIQGSSING